MSEERESRELSGQREQRGQRERRGQRGRRDAARVRWSAVLAAAAASPALCAGVAAADENYHDSPVHGGFSLVRVGQVDDPLEDVLEHASLFKGDYNTY